MKNGQIKMIGFVLLILSQTAFSQNSTQKVEYALCIAFAELAVTLLHDTDCCLICHLSRILAERRL